jgi:hypothetical protein
LESSHAERHAKVSVSLLGPNTGVAEGEVTASFLGPFVGFHHQALAIAVFWPGGKGNVGHGTSAGCNHTSRAPDQECWLGEGTFLGLGVQLKYPIDLSPAPYSVVASGVSLLPQRVVFPFSLINVPVESRPTLPQALNEIIPGWVLTDNLYMLKRAEAKFRVRDHARGGNFDFEVFRPATVERMRDACRLLTVVAHSTDVYTECDLPGLGKNFMSEANRLRALRVYRTFIRLYSLRALLTRLRSARLVEGRPELLLQTASPDSRWEHARRLLIGELGVHDVCLALRELPELLEQEARAVERSKTRDDERGRRIIADYGDVHVSADRDPVVRDCWDEARRLQMEIKGLLCSLEYRPVRTAPRIAPAANISSVR